MTPILPTDRLLFLQHKALQLRIDSIRATTKAKSGHPTTALSSADIVASLFFHIMRYDPSDPQNPNNDRLILSKGHGIPVIYAAWKQVGVISDDELMKLRTFESVLEGHPTIRFPYNEAATGSLGQGLSIGLGMALQAKKKQLPCQTYVLLGDGEIAEGSIWEAAEIGTHYELDNLIGIIDCNRLGQSEPTLHEHDTQRYAKKFEAFGWHALTVDGHDIEAIINACEKDKEIKNRPTMIIAKTRKGYGLEGIEDKLGFHGKPLTEQEATAAITALQEKFSQAFAYKGETTFLPPMPQKVSSKKKAGEITLDLATDPNRHRFEPGNMLATRKAFGYGITALGKESDDVFVFDGDVKNSTYTEIFEKEFPRRFIQCFIAEQNMIGTATGMELRGAIPFAATFACFLTRAFDQIRMAGIGRNALRLSGSHCGISIGADGPSQMGLEDLAMMRSIPNSIVFYPSDAVSTYKMVELMANYHQGISYIRTTRSDTPMIYNVDDEFRIGGCNAVRKTTTDKACIIAAGITLHEALKAQAELEKQSINVAVIDLYCIKPLDTETIKKVAEQSGSKIITVEDHYQAGGIGEAVASALINENVTIKRLHVPDVPRSGSTQKLLAWAKIDAAAIAHAVEQIL